MNNDKEHQDVEDGNVFPRIDKDSFEGYDIQGDAVEEGAFEEKKGDTMPHSYLHRR